MKTHKPLYQYLDGTMNFRAGHDALRRTVYFPLCGIESASLKSSITPFLSGDIKSDKNHYVTKPVSTEDLRYPARNFYISLKNHGMISLADSCLAHDAYVEAGPLWHKLVKTFPSAGVEISALNFIPVSAEHVELMKVSVKNISSQPITFTATTGIPLFARALSNKHDHEHVTSLLHRVWQWEEGVAVEPTMLFNEEGHKDARVCYFVLAQDGKGAKPVGSFPTVQSFYGENGNISAPEAVLRQTKPRALVDNERHGKEAIGALQFGEVTLKPGASQEYAVMTGFAATKNEALAIYKKFTLPAVGQALQENQAFWRDKTQTISFETGDQAFDRFMSWVALQPILRRIFGCSFLPDHDYGKGGKGWRDLWQDLLSLILIEPEQVRATLAQNFAGVRIDGSNATIIGDRPGEFLADRNAITRVWMDHGVWPLMTLALYIHQTGDFNILLQKEPYFRDPQFSRTYHKDVRWSEEQGRQLKAASGNVYEGTLIEHLLIQNLVQFFNVGKHNNIRLENADWNDGLDMAFDQGESVAFTSCYAGNLNTLAALLEDFAQVKKVAEITVAKELSILLDQCAGKHVNYDDVEAKQNVLFTQYAQAVQPVVSGETVTLSIKDVAADLRAKAQWIFEHIRRHEKISVNGHTWFNGYYDNNGERVEGKFGQTVRMTLTGQVYPVMSGLATKEEIESVIKSVDTYLKDSALGGYRLNSDFGLKNYLTLGRAFGFAFGTKENGAFFSHMTVMYANALYARGFVREGHKVLQSIYDMCRDTDKSKIYPGIPEYFDAQGRGMYHYLTGSASWYVLTVLTQVFGVRGDKGDLCLKPQLVKEQFNSAGKASVCCHFAGKVLDITYENTSNKDAGAYQVASATLNETPVALSGPASFVVISRDKIINSSSDVLKIHILLK